MKKLKTLTTLRKLSSSNKHSTIALIFAPTEQKFPPPFFLPTFNPYWIFIELIKTLRR